LKLFMVCLEMGWRGKREPSTPPLKRIYPGLGITNHGNTFNYRTGPME
jgi:hypothetical protein